MGHITWAKSTEATRLSCWLLWTWSQDRLRSSEGDLSLRMAAHRSWSCSGHLGEQRVVCSRSTHVFSSLGTQGHVHGGHVTQHPTNAAAPPEGRHPHRLLYFVAETMRNSLCRASAASGPGSSFCSSFATREQNFCNSSSWISLNEKRGVGDLELGDLSAGAGNAALSFDP